jgi:rSAM/selenodomain-associated transferase 1
MTHNEHTNALLVVAKRPAPGRTKTRLTPPLSPHTAAALYECFLQDTIELMRQVKVARPVLAYLPAEDKPYFNQLAPGFELLVQVGDDLGARLDNATTHYLERGCERVVIMDSDSPTLPVDYLVQAFQALDESTDIVLGPCDDGGYYLIGMKQPAPRLLREVRMSTPNVVDETLKLAREEGLHVQLLPAWYDVDNVEDLERLRTELTQIAAQSAQQITGKIASHTRRFLTQQDL